MIVAGNALELDAPDSRTRREHLARDETLGTRDQRIDPRDERRVGELTRRLAEASEHVEPERPALVLVPRERRIEELDEEERGPVRSEPPLHIVDDVEPLGQRLRGPELGQDRRAPDGFPSLTGPGSSRRDRRHDDRPPRRTRRSRPERRGRGDGLDPRLGRLRRNRGHRGSDRRRPLARRLREELRRAERDECSERERRRGRRQEPAPHPPHLAPLLRLVTITRANRANGARLHGSPPAAPTAQPPDDLLMLAPDGSACCAGDATSNATTVGALVTVPSDTRSANSYAPGCATVTVPVPFEVELTNVGVPRICVQ